MERTKDSYMRELERALNQMDEAQRREILEDYEAHFAISAENGIPESEVIAKLGSVEECAAAILETAAEPIEHAEPNKAEAAQEQAPSDKDETAGTRGGAKSPDTLVIDAGYANVHLFKAEDGQVRSTFAGDERSERLYYDRRDGKTWRVGMEHDHLVYGRVQADICIYVPASVHTLSCNSLSGDVEIQALSLSTGELKTVSGSLRAYGCALEDCKLETVSGSLKAEELRCGKLKTATASGSIRLTDCKGDRVSGGSASGSVKAEELTARELALSSASGSVSVDNSTLKSLSASSVSGSVRVETSSMEAAKLSSTSGSVRLNLFEGVGFDGSFSTLSGSVRLRCGSEQLNVRRGSYRMGDGRVLLQVSTISGSIRVN